MLNKKQKTIITTAIAFSIVVIIFSLVLLMISENNTDKNYYDSLEDIREEKYADKETLYIQRGEYTYLFAKSEYVDVEELIYKNSEGKYIFFNNWHDETNNSKHYFSTKDIDENDFYSYITVDVHNDNYIMLIERYFINDSRPNTIIYDNYSEWKVIEKFGREFYFKVLDANLIDSNYELRVDTGINSYYLIGAKEIGKIE